MTDSRIKGQRFMLGVSRALSTWVVGTDPKAKAGSLPFRPRETIREPAEGHWELKGDIRCRPDVYFPFSVECKKDESWSLEGLMEAPKCPVWKWWEQAKTQAAAGFSAIPLLIFSRNRRKNYVLMRANVHEWFALKPSVAPHLMVRRPSGEQLALVVLDDLLGVKAKMPRGDDLRALLSERRCPANSRMKVSSRPLRKSSGLRRPRPRRSGGSSSSK